MKLIVFCTLLALGFCADPKQANENVNSFDSVDLDDNGKLTLAEFQQWQMGKMGENDEGKIRALFNQYDIDHSSDMDVSEFVPLAFAISQKPIDTEETIFRRMDVNGDGVVDKMEQALLQAAGEGPIIEGILAVADANRDGKLTHAEYKTALGFNRPKSQADINRETAFSLMSFIDANMDNALETKEIHHYANKHTKISESQVNEVVALLDVNQDGRITVDELERIPVKMTSLLGFAPPPTVV